MINHPESTLSLDAGNRSGSTLDQFCIKEEWYENWYQWGGGLVYLAIRLWRDQSKKWARTLFWYSNMYLAAIFAIMVLDRVMH